MKMPGKVLAQERGSGTVMALALILVALALILGVAQVGVAAAGGAASHNAADLAAIAGATDLMSGGEGCPLAKVYAAKNGARMVSCTVSGWMLSVKVVKPLGFGLVKSASASSRAGPEFAQ